MDMTGEYRVPAPRQAVWEALNDPEILKRSIPGCEEVQKISDTEMTAKVTAKVGPVKARFAGKVTLSDLDPPNGYKITGEGTGGAAGFAKGGAAVQLSDAEEGGTLLTYKVEAHVGGKLAQIGSRLIDATSRKMADEFFSRFVEIVGAAAAEPAAPAPEAVAQPLAETLPGPAPEPAAAPEAAPLAAAPAEAPVATTATPAPAVTPPPQPAAPPPEPPRRGVPPLVWVVGLAVVVAVVLYFFTRH